MSGGEQVTAGDICRREDLPQQFVYKILKKLQRAGLVQITRGAEGGCRLSSDLRKITLYDLAEIMEADKMISACMRPGFQCSKNQESQCRVNKRLRQIQQVLDAELRAHSLYEMLADEN